MGRYTTVQAYSDNNPKLVHVSYDQAKGKDDADGTAGGKLVVEKTDQVMGSCAGAGSGEFHTYRAHRRREMHRVAAMDEESQNDEAKAKLQAAISQGQKECEERTRKKAEKRKRRKEAEKRNPNKKAKGSRGPDQPKADAASKASSSGSGGGSSGVDNGGSNSSDGDVVEEFIYIPVADQAASGGDGGAPAAFKNDGTFLEMMRKELAGSGDAAKSLSGVGSGSNKAVAAK